MHCVLIYKTVADYIEKRADFREVHLAHAKKAQEDGYLILGGAYAEPADGALLIFKGEDAVEYARDFAINDPYVTNGLITAWQVRQWSVVIGTKMD
ncbi:MAG: hypothetical protein CL868_09720 [Cytophagaceae bacterium]|nr:hypothetical protein [Cytophagaceae bacterium]|tara:strand:- start:675 stop:962 length:288 start_codon:yes stop_codon:yes gene_type:complete